jgi:ribonucleoside-diphosphate reductase alpha chain
MTTLTPNALTVLQKRYLLPGETPDAMFRRVACLLAETGARYGHTPEVIAHNTERYHRVMAALDFLPNSPTLANAGARTGQLSACFVLPVEDDLEGIFESVKHAALIHKTGGGTGFSFSRLRRANAVVAGTGGASSGPISFMEVFNAATESIKQGGMRRGANMGILRVDHPDILAFIDHKADLSKLTNFNVSVAITDAFMAAVEAGTEYDLVDPHDGQVVGRLDAGTVWRRVIERAWGSGEPGVVFIDRMNKDCPVPWLGGYEATNPCGEQPLLPYESCNLGSINLENFVVEREGAPAVDWERLAEVVWTATQMLDAVIDANVYPIPQIGEVSRATRKIGLGVMGFARMLYRLGVAYGAPESQQLAGHLMSFIDYHSKYASVDLARERGAFPALAGHEDAFTAIFSRWCRERQAHPHRHPEVRYDWLAVMAGAHGLRNSTTTTIAPTGTLSLIAGTSGGCEPAFALAFRRWQAETHMIEADPVFRAYCEGGAIGWSEALEGALDASHGSLVEVVRELGEGAPEALVQAAAVFRVAHDVSPGEHVGIQAAFQAFNDSATSKTINFAHGASVEEVAEAYRLAWETGCKGITIYRDGCRAWQPLSTTAPKEAEVLAVAPVAAPEEGGCPSCGGPVVAAEGCESCPSCGWSACSVA